ncbi:hypothetical protein D046_7336B, partial [Vibrio parahaemolyticus V-223/04]
IRVQEQENNVFGKEK